MTPTEVTARKHFTTAHQSPDSTSLKQLRCCLERSRCHFSRPGRRNSRSAIQLHRHGADISMVRYQGQGNRSHHLLSFQQQTSKLPPVSPRSRPSLSLLSKVRSLSHSLHVWRPSHRSTLVRKRRRQPQHQSRPRSTSTTQRRLKHCTSFSHNNESSLR